MTIELSLPYEIRVADLDAVAARGVQTALQPPWSSPYVVGAFLRGAVAYFLFADLVHLDTREALLAGVAVGALWWSWVPRRARALYAERMHARLAAPGSRFLVGPRTLELGAEGFAVLGPESEFRFKWSALQRVVETPERLFLYLTGFTAHVVPLSPADASRVLATIRQHAPAVFEARTVESSG